MSNDRWGSFNEAHSLRDAMSALLQDSFVRPGVAGGQEGHARLPLDIAEDGAGFIIRASLPGVRPEDVQITVLGDTLTIRGEAKAEEEMEGGRWHVRERRLGALQRSVTLATPVDPDKADARFEHGVLTLRLPRSEAAKPRQIKVGGAK